MTTEMGSPNACPDTRRTTGDSQTSPSPSTMELSNSPVSSNSLTMEESLDYTVRPRARRMHASLSYMPLPIMHLTNPSNPFPPGFAVASGVTVPPMPFSRMPSMTSMTGDSSPTSTDTDNSTRITCTWSRSWSFSKQNKRASSKTELLSKTGSFTPDSAKRSSTSLFARLRAPFSRPGREGAPSSHPDSFMPRDEDVSM